MSTTTTFQNMLNEYLPNDLFKDELIARDWYLQNMQKDNNWKGGDIIVPFQGNAASSVKFGGLTADTDIAEYGFVRGKISGYKEVWGSLTFNETDIMQHDGRVNEQSFLRILPDQIEDFMNYMKVAVSINLLSGPHFAKVTDVTNAATGILVVDKIDRFELAQKLDLSDGATTRTVYVIKIDINANKITASATRGGAAADLTAGNAVTTSHKAYHDGILVASTPTNGFLTVRQALLPASLGGSDTLHGQTKLSYPALQAVRVDGSGITAANILDKLFDAWSTLKSKAKAATPDKAVMSYKNMGAAMKVVENGLVSAGGASITRVIAKPPKVSKYGWTEIEIVGVKGSFTIVGIQEMDDDVIYFLDMSAATFRTNGFFMKKKSPEGLEYYRVRSTSGYKLVCDVCLFGEQEFRKPAVCATVHSINF